MFTRVLFQPGEEAMARHKDLYKADGVDVAAGDVFSAFCKKVSEKTHHVSPYVQFHDLSRGNFRGPRGYRLVRLPENCIETGVVDGVGTKVVLIVAAGNVQTTASGLIAMTGMDITRWGGLPLVFLNILDVRTLGEIDSPTFAAYQEMMFGLGALAHKHRFVILSGETAELGLCVGSENPTSDMMFNWGGVMLGVYHPDKMILGDTLKPGQSIIALQDDFRNNGISSVRKSLALRYGSEWWSRPDAMPDILATASSSAQYDRMFNDAHGWFNRRGNFVPKFKMHLIVHLSGGAIKSKLGEDMLKPLELSAELPNLCDPPEIMKKCATWRKMDSYGCYSSWNGGQGALAVVDEADEKPFIAHAQRYGIRAQPAGNITRRKKYLVRIKSKFDGKTVTY